MSEKDIQYLKDNVQKILTYLHNDEGTGELGLVAEVKQLKKEFSAFVSEYHTSQAVKRAKIGLLGTIGGVLGTGLVWVAEKIVSHFH